MAAQADVDYKVGVTNRAQGRRAPAPLLSTPVLAQLAFMGVAALAVFTFVHAAQNDRDGRAAPRSARSARPYAGRNRIAPDFELPDLDGKPVRLSSFRGKTVFLNFWTKTCKPLPRGDAVARRAREDREEPHRLRGRHRRPPTRARDDVRDTLKVALNGERAVPVLLRSPETIVADKLRHAKLFPRRGSSIPKGVIRARFDGARDWSASLAHRDRRDGAAAPAAARSSSRECPSAPIRGPLRRRDSGVA